MPGKLILASSSPRRRGLLSSLDLNFKAVPAQATEVPCPHETPRDFAMRVAERKARSVGERHPDAWIIGADTVVTVDGTILGKPRGKAEAKQMLRQLSGKEHLVITGYALVRLAEGKMVRGAEETRVKVKTLEEDEIDWYINTGEPFDKAGGYAIQGKAAFMIEWVQGSYTNVVGLPLCQLVRLLREQGIIETF